MTETEATEFFRKLDEAGVHSYGGAYFLEEEGENAFKRLYLEGAFTLEELQKVVALWKEFREDKNG